MYSLTDSVAKVKGIGPKTKKVMGKKGIKTVGDLLLYLPLRYDDRSQIVNISQLQVGQTFTLKAEVVKTSEYFKNKRRITSAIIQDQSGKTKCIWFNNRYIKRQLKKGDSYFFSGKYTKFHTLTQPVVEPVRQETIHTGRLVPLYSVSLDIAQGNLRRMLKEVVDNLKLNEDKLAAQFQLMPIPQALKQLHFPQEEEKVIQARKRLALEELLALMEKSNQIKESWESQQSAAALDLKLPKNLTKKGRGETQIIPNTIPFDLTQDQLQAVSEILTDMNSATPMNRLLIGDVGTGKTVVAGIACHHMIQQDEDACLVAPTQILAKQHFATFEKIFPDLPLKLLTADTTSQNKDIDFSQPHLFIGTHAVINQFEKIKPALIIYDEQHRFGVEQRSEGLVNDLSEASTENEASTEKNKVQTASHNKLQPHLLTMTATPIPRSFMLTIFSHLEASIIKESPFGPKPIKTWMVPEHKKQDAYEWVADKLQQNKKQKNSQQQNKSEEKDGKKEQAKITQPKEISGSKTSPSLAIVVCPFIDPSDHEAFADISSATEVYDQLRKKFKTADLNITLLHGQQNSKQKQKIISQLFNQEIDILVTTSIVEVGVDLPQANYMIIENADRFGLASLHQLRGRVGRQGQKSYCLLFSQSKSKQTNHRLKQFAQINNGLKLAELDLKNRGGGDLFGLNQHGFDNLRFASWSNSELIADAREIFSKLKKQDQQPKLLFNFKHDADNLPAAN